MSDILNFMMQGHGQCDELFTTAEQSVSEANWTLAGTGFSDFLAACETHFSMEEQVLFPQIERFSGQSGGPTQVMRMEHGQIRGLFQELRETLSNQNQDEFLGTAETLLILMQQHNMKEEQILYPMSDRVLAENSESVINAMEALHL